jgi:hypothetical protein
MKAWGDHAELLPSFDDVKLLEIVDEVYDPQL